VFDTNIKHFPFSDHDLVSTKLKLDDIERGPGIWAMNFNTITSELFTKAFNTWWGIWKNEIERFRNIQEWWDVTKTKIKYLTMQISKQLKKGQNKKDIEKFEKQLEDLKSSTDDGDIIKDKILELENLIKKHYTHLLALFSSHPSVVNSLEYNFICSSIIESISYLYLPSVFLIRFHILFSPCFFFKFKEISS
jgi:hypothetical protein